MIMMNRKNITITEKAQGNLDAIKEWTGLNNSKAIDIAIQMLTDYIVDRTRNDFNQVYETITKDLIDSIR